MSYANIIGRNKEINILDRIYKSKKSELIAIYGRRRVGKSYLVSECFGKKILFKAVGTYIKDGDKDYDTASTHWILKSFVYCLFSFVLINAFIP